MALHHGRHAWDAKQHFDVAGMQEMPYNMLTQYMPAMHLQASSTTSTELWCICHRGSYHSSHHLPECKASFSQMPQQLLLCRTTRSALERQDLARTYLAHRELESEFIIIVY